MGFFVFFFQCSPFCLLSTCGRNGIVGGEDITEFHRVVWVGCGCGFIATSKLTYQEIVLIICIFCFYS